MLLDIIRNASSYSMTDVVILLSAMAMMIFIALPVHEMAHGFMAVRLGDNTPKYSGRLSFKPTAHLDLFGTLCLLFCGFGWAKPVEVNPYNFRNQKQGMALTALAGPVSNIIMALVSLLVAKLLITIFPDLYYDLYSETVVSIIVSVLSQFALINISLAVFNLIPFPPLDGSRILGLILPNRIYYTIMQYERQLQIILFAVIFLGSGSGFISKLSTIVYIAMYRLVEFIF